MVAWRPRHLTVAQFEERRMAAAQLFRTGGFSDTQIARQLGVTRGAVSKWHAAWRQVARHGWQRDPRWAVRRA